MNIKSFLLFVKQSTVIGGFKRFSALLFFRFSSSLELASVLDLLEVKSFNESVQLVDCLFKLVADEAVSEDHRVVGLFNLFDSLLNSDLELLFSLNTGS